MNSVEHKKLLLVEDEAIIALNEQRTLGHYGYQVLAAYSGEAALGIVDREADIDLILMDIDLGAGIDGTETAQLILKKHDIPILFLSSHTEPELVRKTEEITNYGYVVKSSSFTVLDASIKMALKLFSTQRNLALSEEKFSTAFHSSPDSINLNRLSDGVFVDINEGFTKMTGYTREDVIGRSSLPGDLGIWISAGDRKRVITALDEKGELSNSQIEFRRKDGSIVLGLMSAKLIKINGASYNLSITRDISEYQSIEERTQTEKSIRQLLEEKELNLREVHHRIKNNMATISSLINLQESKVSSREAKEALRDTRNRLLSMLVLNDKLYKSPNFTKVSTEDFLSSLIHEILANYPEGSLVGVREGIGDFQLDPKKLQTLGLITNELLTNIMKYAFEDPTKGEITVSLESRGTRAVFSISDNGKGMPSGVDFDHSPGFGLVLVKELSKQLDGSVEIIRESGTCVSMAFTI